MALLSAADRKVMEEAQRRGSDLCGRVNMPPLFMRSQAGAGGRRGHPSHWAMSEPLEWPRPGQAAEAGCRERKHQSECGFFFSFILSAESHSCLFWGRGSLESTWLSPSSFPSKTLDGFLSVGLRRLPLTTIPLILKRAPR